jgi:ParB family transcriptional regulator, chromosome partitioning protein
MLTTKRYEYIDINKIGIHDQLINHRLLDAAKVAHLEKDILSNGLLEPLVVWERTPGEYYLVGGFHRMAAISGIRKKNPGYFDRIDVRVVAGDPDEIKALNLKLNSDRVDTRITDYFQTVLYLNNANWPKERITEFFDKSVSWIEEIVRYAPMVTLPMHEKLSAGELSWNRAKEIIQKSLKAPVGKEKETMEEELSKAPEKVFRPLTFRSAISRLSKVAASQPKRTFTLDVRDLYSLILTLQGKRLEPEHIERVRKSLPELMDD